MFFHVGCPGSLLNACNDRRKRPLWDAGALEQAGASTNAGWWHQWWGPRRGLHQLPPPPLIIVLCPTTSITYNAHPGNGHSRSVEICSPFCGSLAHMVEVAEVRSGLVWSLPDHLCGRVVTVILLAPLLTSRKWSPSADPARWVNVNGCKW